MKIHFFDKITDEKIRGLQQGFFLSFSETNKVVLTIKLNAALLTSLLKGCPLSLILNKKNSSLKLVIEDNKESPFYIIGINFSEKSDKYPNFENVIISLLKSDSFKLIYLNDLNYQVFNTNINKIVNIKNFENWLLKDDEEFIIKIENRDFTSEIDVTIIDHYESEKWNGNLINKKPYYNFKEYLSDGKHGYNQEFSIRSFLSSFFTPNKELFFSILKTNNQELTDFLIIHKRAVLIIESKYTISKKQNKFNDSIVKGILQLNGAENIIYNDLNQIENAYLRNQLSTFQVVIKICLFNDDGRDLKIVFKNIEQKYDKNSLPIFISVSTFSQFLVFSKIQNLENYKTNIISNILHIKSKYIKQKVIVLDGFETETGAITLLY